MVSTNGKALQCCYLTKDPVPFAPGNSTLYVRNDVKTTCMFGYDPSTGCKQCLQGYRVSANYTTNFSVSLKFLEFNLNFVGRLCSEITGTNYTVLLFFSFSGFLSLKIKCMTDQVNAQYISMKSIEVWQFISNYKFCTKGTVSGGEIRTGGLDVTGAINRDSGTWKLTRNSVIVRPKLVNNGMANLTVTWPWCFSGIQPRLCWARLFRDYWYELHIVSGTCSWSIKFMAKRFFSVGTVVLRFLEPGNWVEAMYLWLKEPSPRMKAESFQTKVRGCQILTWQSSLWCLRPRFFNAHCLSPSNYLLLEVWVGSHPDLEVWVG